MLSLIVYKKGMTKTPALNLDSVPPFEGKARADWELLVEKGLKGTDMDSLTHRTEDELTRGPLTTLSDRSAAPAAIRGSTPPLLSGRDWHICAPVRDPELAFANQQLFDDLNGGASAARITLGETGVPITRAADLTRLFEQVHLDLIPISFRDATDRQIEDILSTADLSQSHVTLGLDIIQNESTIANVIDRCPDNWRAITLCSARVHEAGGTDAQELAVMAASVVMAMNVLGAKTAAKHMSIEIAIDRDAHLSIAKARAARRIYARIAQNYGLTDTSVPLYAISSKRMMQSVSPWTNMLRIMSAGFGAVVGGADYVTLRPFTDTIGGATPFGYRAARNMQLLMMEESHLGTVSDPAHGSYFHEHMSEELAQAAWAKFQAIEASGGIKAYHGSSDYKADIEAAAAARAERGEPVLGVTLHKADPLREAKTRGTSS